MFYFNALRKSKDTIIFLFVMMLYCLNRFFLREVVSVPLISDILKCHFNDCCGSVAFLSYINLVLACSKYRHKQIQSIKTIILIVLGISICWEGFAPLISSKSTADWFDVLAYMIGGLSYWVIKQLWSRNATEVI